MYYIFASKKENKSPRYCSTLGVRTASSLLHMCGTDNDRSQPKISALFSNCCVCGKCGTTTTTTACTTLVRRVVRRKLQRHLASLTAYYYYFLRTAAAAAIHRESHAVCGGNERRKEYIVLLHEGGGTFAALSGAIHKKSNISSKCKI